MTNTNPSNILDFGRVMYVEPNNNIVGGGNGTNFTFNPEDYSILVDLQVDVVDRYAYNGNGGNEVIQYTLEWNAKGTKTSLFKGTNGLLTTKALDTSFDDISRNLNQEAIGINSIDIRYNSWNYPEVTINFTDIRGASLLASADLANSGILPEERQRVFDDNFANTFFSTFFRFPYPMYTLIVKGFYGRPVTYSLCVNDFKTKFNSSTGNFDVTVSFIGYMYGLLTDIPMRLLFAAPYNEYAGAKHWRKMVDNGTYAYDGGQTMLTFIELNEKLKAINENLEKLPAMQGIMEEMKECEDRKTNLQEVANTYDAFKGYFNGESVKNRRIGELSLSVTSDGVESVKRKYLVLFSSVKSDVDTVCDNCRGTGKVAVLNNSASVYGGYTPTYKTCDVCSGVTSHTRSEREFDDVVVEESAGRKIDLYLKIKEYNGLQEDSGTRLSFIPRITNDAEASSLLRGTVMYQKTKGENRLSFIDSQCVYGNKAFVDVAEEDFPKVKEYLRGDEANSIVNSMSQVVFVGVTVLRVDEFEEKIDSLTQSIESEMDVNSQKIEEVQENTYSELLEFKVTLRNVINMCLAHLDTFMECMYKCMDEIKTCNNGTGRLFSQANMSSKESDVQSTTEGESSVAGSPLYLPPFFAFRKISPKSGELEDEWIGNDPRFENEDVFREIPLINGFLNGTLKAQTMAREAAESLIAKESVSTEQEIAGKHFVTSFVTDYYLRQNPYTGAYKNLEDLMSMFAFRCMLATIYSVDFPNIANRFDRTNDTRKRSYFEQFGINDASNFTGNDEEFKKFRDSSLKDEFSKLTWEKFEAYITGKCVEGGLVQNAMGHKYFTGNMASPLFSKGAGNNNYVLSYGSANGEYVVPSTFISSDEAISYANSLYDKYKSGSSQPEINAFGISREFGMPNVEVIGDDRKLGEDRPSITVAFEDICKGGDVSEAGWYFKNEKNWKEYFSGVITGEHAYWFPSLVMTKDIKTFYPEDLASANYNGNLYDGRYVDDKQIYAYAPAKECTNLRDFFITKESAWWRNWFGKKNNQARVKSNSSNDNYTETKVMKSLFEEGNDSVTLIGLPCAEGTLFESEFYLLQNEMVDSSKISRINSNLKRNYTESEIKMFRKAFLFLHSLPTSEYGALSRVVETIMKRTYTPSVSDIPLSSALFIGALYFREMASGGRDAEDALISYSSNVSDYKKASAGQLLTYDWLPTNTAKLDLEKIRRPLNPLKTSSKISYLTVIDKETEDKFNEKEKSSFSWRMDDNLRNLIEGNINDKNRYVGFWDVVSSIKVNFMELFENWVNNDFVQIERELSLRDKDGNEFTIPMVSEIKEIVSGNVFNNMGVANNDFNGTYYKIKKKDIFNDFVKDVFNYNFFKNHDRFGASIQDTSLFTFLKYGSDIMKLVNGIVLNGATVTVPFPRVLMTRDVFSKDFPSERTKLEVDGEILKAALLKFYDEIMKAAEKEVVDDEEDEKVINNVLPSSVSPAAKLSLYETLKNVHDKWLIANDRRKYEFGNNTSDTQHRNIADNFYYINSFYEDVGDEISLNAEELPKQIDNVIENGNSPNSLYSFMYDIANQARVQLLALPVFNDLSDNQYIREMFSPIPYDKIDSTKIYTESQYVFFYPEEASKQVNIPNSSKNEEERYKFADDSFTFVTESGQQNVKDLPNTFNDSTGRKVPVFGVTFAKQNQSFFKNINVSMDSPKTTEVVVHNTFAIANKFKGGNNQVTALGQDLFPIYSNYSYECSVEMMGCACIMPLMYFQLNNIPMFKGTYIIYNVSHSITPGNMTTSFSGQRLSKFRKKRNEDSMAASPNENGFLGRSKTVEKSYDTIIDACYTPSGHKLENEYVYDKISKETGISDKAALRAVEYAETHYSGGFFPGGKLKIYYDPWIAQNKSVSGDGLTVSSQYETNYAIAKTYEENLDRVSRAAKSLDDEDASSIASSCTITGAFGVPAVAYDKCGFETVKDFLDTSKKGFSQQGSIFSALLKSMPELRNALQNKDWQKFANLYKGQGGVTEPGVFSPGDSGFTKYARDLEAGYFEARNASSEYYSVYKETNPNTMINTQENDPNARAIDIEKTIRYLKSHAQPESVHSCAAYVKDAIQAGGITRESCNASDCKESRFIKEDCYKLYDSEPGDYGTRGNKMNPNWERGDIVIIDNFGEHKYGHIAMWTGNQWISDFKQNNCDIYKDGKTAWDSGKFHFYRFKNRINV